MAETGRGDASQLFGQTDRRRMRHPAQECVLELGRLGLDRLDQTRMAVSQVYTPPRGDTIEQNSSVNLMQSAALGRVNDGEG